MALKTIADLKYSVSGILTGTNLDNVNDLYGAIARAFRTVLQTVYIPEASANQSLMLYDGVYDYPVSSSIFGGTLNDLRPQGVSRNPFTDYVYKRPIDQFDRTKAIIPNGYMVTFEWDQGTPIMRVAQTKTTPAIILDAMSATTGWATGGTASGLALDQTVYYESPAALRFNVASGAGYIEKTQTYAIDMSAYAGVALGFVALYTPDVADLTSLELRIGSNSTNYYAVTATAGFVGAFKLNKFILVAFDLSKATQVGAPVTTAMSYSRITVNVTANINNIRLGNLFFALPSPHTLMFETNAIFIPNIPNAVPLNTITGDSDQIALSEPAYNLFETEAASEIASQQGGGIAGAIVGALHQKLHGVRAPRTGALIELGLYDLYRADNPSGELRQAGSYYDDSSWQT